MDQDKRVGQGPVPLPGTPEDRQSKTSPGSDAPSQADPNGPSLGPASQAQEPSLLGSGSPGGLAGQSLASDSTPPPPSSSPPGPSSERPGQSAQGPQRRLPLRRDIKNAQASRALADPASLPQPAWLGRWPLVILILGFMSIGGCYFTAMGVVESFQNMRQSDYLAQDGLGVLAIEGEIVSTQWAVETLERFKENSRVRAVVLRIDSPGGAVAPCQELYQALKDFPKPVVVSLGSVAASGGLYLAVARRPIMASPGTLTGSIGVIMESIEFGEAMAKLGLRSQVIKSGRYKDVLSPFRQMLPEERALLENMVMEVYEQFVGDVVAGRPKMGEKAVREVADGRVFSGQTALKIGLVDQIGGYREALRKAAELGGLPHAGELPPVIYEDGRGGWVQRLLSESLSFMRPVSQAVRPGVTMKFIYQPGL